MAVVNIKELLDAGVHFGHKASRWNPQMKSYIIKKKNRIHIINLKKTVKALAKGRHFLKNMAAQGKTILFVGTKRQAREAIETQAKRCEMPYINNRWLGGFLTNHDIIVSRIDRYHELLGIEESDRFKYYSKKQIARHNREKERIYKNLAGVMDLSGLPDILLVVGLWDEMIAVREANKIGIPVVAIADTDADPTTVDCPIPSNDESFQAVNIILEKLTDGIVEGRRLRTENAPKAASFSPDERLKKKIEEADLEDAGDEKTEEQDEGDEEESADEEIAEEQDDQAEEAAAEQEDEKDTSEEPESGSEEEDEEKAVS